MKRILIVVDYQNDFVDGSLGFEQAKTLEGKILDKIHQYKKRGDDVVFTFDTHEKDYFNTREGKDLPVAHCIRDTYGWQLYGKVKDEYTSTTKGFIKNTFGSLDLAVYLQKEQFDEIELVGLVTNICVLSNAVIAKAACPESRIIVDESCCASFDEDLHRKSMDILKGVYIEIAN